MTKEQFLRDFINLSAEEKVNFAKKSTNVLSHCFDTLEDWIGFMRSTSGFFAASNGNIDKSEVALYNFVTGDNMTFEEFFNMAQAMVNDKTFLNSYWNLVTNQSPEFRLYLAYYICALLGLDDEYDSAEIATIMGILPDLSDYN